MEASPGVAVMAMGYGSERCVLPSSRFFEVVLISSHIAPMLNTDSLLPLPIPDNVKPRPLTTEEESRIDTLSRLQFVSMRSIESVETLLAPGCPLSDSFSQLRQPDGKIIPVW